MHSTAAAGEKDIVQYRSRRRRSRRRHCMTIGVVFPPSSSSSRGNYHQLGKLTIVQLNDALHLENKLNRIADILMC